MRVRPATTDDAAELGRAFKVVVDEKRWVAVQPPVTADELAEGIRTRLSEGQRLFALEDDAAAATAALWSAWSTSAPPASPASIRSACGSSPDNEAAIALYERAGFEREGVRRDHYRRRDGRLHSSLIMARLFPDATPPSSQ